MAGAFLVSDFGLLVMMLRAFSRDLPCCSDRTIAKNKKLGIFATFLRLGALLGSFRLEICHFCCVFVPRFAIGSSQQLPIAKKLQFGPIFCFWVPGRAPEAVLGCYGLDAERGLNLIRRWVVVGPMWSGGGSGAGQG